MPPSPEKWLTDIIRHGTAAVDFLKGKELSSYLEDEMLQAALERKLFIVGEAVTQIRNLAPDLSEQINSAREIIGFRNLLAHSYFSVDHSRVWDIARTHLPQLIKTAQELLDESEN